MKITQTKSTPVEVFYLIPGVYIYNLISIRSHFLEINVLKHIKKCNYIFIHTNSYCILWVDRLLAWFIIRSVIQHFSDDENQFFLLNLINKREKHYFGSDAVCICSSKKNVAEKEYSICFQKL